MARKAFRFRLQRLLEIRIMREKTEQATLRAYRLELQQEEQRLVLLQQQEAALKDQLVVRPGEPFDIPKRVSVTHALELKRKEQDAQRGRIQQAEQKVAAQTEVVKQAGIAVKALEKLREKQLEEHHQEQLREQGLFLDDLSGQQFIRQQTEKVRLSAEEADDQAAEQAAADETMEII